MEKKTKHDIIVVFLTAGIILSFLIFAFCVVIYIINSYRINNIVFECTEKSDQVAINAVNTFKELQNYYKDANNFNIISLLYVLISTVLMGTLGLYVQRQKERLDNFENKKEKIESEVNSFKENLKKCNEQLEGLQPKIESNQLSLSEMKEQIIYSQGYQSYFTLIQKLGVSLNYATNINSICSAQVINTQVLSEYTTRFRDIMNELIKYDDNSIKTISTQNKDFIITQIYSIIDILRFAINKSNGEYDEETHKEFIDYCQMFIKKLGKVEE